MKASENALHKDEEQYRRKRNNGYVEDDFMTKMPCSTFAADSNRFRLLQVALLLTDISKPYAMKYQVDHLQTIQSSSCDSLTIDATKATLLAKSPGHKCSIGVLASRL